MLARVPEKSPLRESPIGLCAEAAIALTAGNSQRAVDVARATQQRLARVSHNHGFLRAESDWLGQLIVRAEVAGNAPVAGDARFDRQRQL
jgi:hypothetical protein